MKFKSVLTRVLLVCCLTSSWGCVEYRLRQHGQPDVYYGWAKTIKGLDPKLGSKGKIYFTDQGTIRPYIAGNLRRNNARINLGVIHYLNNNTSIEIGYLKALFEVDYPRYYNSYRADPFKDAEEIFYIGGVIRF